MTSPGIYRTRIGPGLLGMALLLTASVCSGQSTDPASTGLRINGFGSIGLVRANTPAAWGFKREIDQPDHSGGTRFDTDSRLGVQFNHSPNQHLELVGQLLAMRRSPLNRDSDVVQWAFAAYRPTPDLTVRVGRVNLDQFLLSDYRNVGFAYMFARPPVEFYGALPSSLDGADISRGWNHAGAQWRAKVFAGGARSSDVVVRPVVGLMLSRQSDGLLLRASLSRAVLKTVPSELQPLLGGLAGLGALPHPGVANEAAALRSRLDFADSVNVYAALGASYEKADWLVSTEITRVTGHPAAAFSAGYFGLGRRFGPLTIYGVASSVETPAAAAQTPDWAATLTPIVGPALAQQAQLLGAGAAYAINRAAANQRSFTLGAKWDVNPRLSMKFQYDHVLIDANGGRMFANADLRAARAKITSVVLDFLF